MMYHVLMFMLIGSVNALMNIRPSIKSFKYVGSTAPFENFDPLNIVEGKSENRVKYTREAELQHGRAAMLGLLIGVATEAITGKGIVEQVWSFNQATPGLDFSVIVNLFS